MIQQAGESSSRCLQIDRLTGSNSSDVRQALFQTIIKLRSNYKPPRGEITFTDELVREVEAYLLALYKRVDSQKLDGHFSTIEDFFPWVFDHIYKKFGFEYSIDEEYEKILHQQLREDPELKKVNEESFRIRRVIFKRLMERKSL